MVEEVEGDVSMKRRKRKIRKILEAFEELEQCKKLNRALTTYLVAKELSEVASMLAEITDNPEYKREFERQGREFKALSKIVVKTLR